MRAALALSMMLAFGMPAEADEPPTILALTLSPDPTTSPPGILAPHVRPRADADRGALAVEGTASPPGIVVRLVATDDLGIQARFDIPTETRDDPNFGTVPGAFRTALRLTDLGRHRATQDADAPDDLGRSLITLRLSVFDQDGTETDFRELTIEKRAGTPGDVNAPILTQTKRPPQDWCHAVADHQGNCFVPLLNPDRPDQHPSPWAEIGGHVEDFTTASLGVASEIADVVVRIFRPDGTMYMERRAFLRNGTRAHFSVALNINDFEPNAPLQAPYRYTIDAIDAWGHTSNQVSGTFNVYAI